MQPNYTLALFDFDGTLTTTDTFTAFIKFAVPKKRILLGYLLLWPFILGYKLKLVSPSRIRRAICYVGFKGESQSSLNQKGKEFSYNYIVNVLRVDIINKLHWHQSQGHRVIILSASLHTYLQHWVALNNVELVCSELAFHGGTATGRYMRGDCTGQDKVRMLSTLLNVEDFETIYAYGDTREDLPMLGLATHKFYQGNAITDIYLPLK